MMERVYNRKEKRVKFYMKGTFEMKRLGLLVILVIMVVLFMGCGACTNPVTPAGQEGYLYKNPYILGEKKFYGTQVGQTSAGISWRLYVYNLDMQPQTMDEGFEVLSKDQLMLHFRAHIIVNPKPHSIREVVEKYGAGAWYARNMQQLFRSEVYTEVARYDALTASDKRSEIAELVKTKLQKYFEKDPFNIRSVIIGNIQLPDTVAAAVEQKLKATQELLQRETQVKITEKDAEIKVIEARGIARAQEIINNTLTPYYLQHEAIEAQLKMAKSPNNTIIYVPVSPNTGIPLVQQVPIHTVKKSVGKD